MASEQRVKGWRQRQQPPGTLEARQTGGCTASYEGPTHGAAGGGPYAGPSAPRQRARAVRKYICVRMKESEATDRLIAKHGPVNALRLLGWAWKLELEGEEWIRERVSRQQLAFIQRQFAEADVPWRPGAIDWPRIMSAGKRALDDARATKAARAARRGPRTA